MTTGQETKGQETKGQETTGQETTGQETTGQETTGQETVSPDPALVEAVIDTQIRPLLRVHGGDIVLIGATGGDVELEFKGACCACALKSVTYAIGVRERLRHLPGVRNVNVRGVSLSAAALERVARAYAAHPLLPAVNSHTGVRRPAEAT